MPRYLYLVNTVEQIFRKSLRLSLCRWCFRGDSLRIFTVRISFLHTSVFTAYVCSISLLLMFTREHI